jgi:hypothetical protein
MRLQAALEKCTLFEKQLSGCGAGCLENSAATERARLENWPDLLCGGTGFVLN